jgi:hypothetical protein
LFILLRIPVLQEAIMAPNTTAVKFAGLLVALGLFGMGPGTVLVDEFLMWRDKQKRKRNDDHGEQPPPAQSGSHLGGEAQEQTTEELKRRYTYTNHPEANDFLSHPFQPAVATTTTTRNKNSPAPALAHTPAPNEKQQTSAPTAPSWLSFWGPPKSSE